MSEREAFLRRFHARCPGITARVLVRGGSYARLAARVPDGARVLDLACGDAALLALLPPGAIGLDLSRDELAAAPRGARVVRGRAQALPFAAAAFDVVTCHLGFMLFDDPAAVVAELARVLAPGGSFVAVLGGGPVEPAPPGDAFHRFLAILGRRPRAAPPLGDRRARTEAGWRALFAGWEVAPFERWQLDLGGTFDEVWAFLAASYELAPDAAAAIRAELAGELAAAARVPCDVAVYLARAIRR